MQYWNIKKLWLNLTSFFDERWSGCSPPPPHKKENEIKNDQFVTLLRFSPCVSTDIGRKPSLGMLDISPPCGIICGRNSGNIIAGEVK